MFCAFAGPPKIVRLHGKGRVVSKASPEWGQWQGRFVAHAAPRAVIVIDLTRISDSCGYGVPNMDFKQDRDALGRWAATKGDVALAAYRLEKNTKSIDGLPGLGAGEV